MSNASITAWSINRLGDEKKKEFIAQVAKWLGSEEQTNRVFEVRFDAGKKTATIFWYSQDEEGNRIWRADGLGPEFEYQTVDAGGFDHSLYDGAYVSAEMWDE